MPAFAGMTMGMILATCGPSLDASFRWHDTHQEASVNGTSQLFAFIFYSFNPKKLKE